MSSFESWRPSSARPLKIVCRVKSGLHKQGTPFHFSEDSTVFSRIFSTEMTERANGVVKYTLSQHILVNFEQVKDMNNEPTAKDNQERLLSPNGAFTNCNFIMMNLRPDMIEQLPSVLICGGGDMINIDLTTATAAEIKSSRLHYCFTELKEPMNADIETKLPSATR